MKTGQRATLDRRSLRSGYSSLSRNVFVAICGAAALALAMGVGRFSFTPIIPLMKATFHLSNAYTSLLASVNYFGYLIGALLTRSRHLIAHRRSLCLGGLVASALTTLVMALTTNAQLWLLLRLLSGIASALVFVYASGIILDRAAHLKQTSWNGVFYGGVGAGIALTAIVMMTLARAADWRQSWLYMAALSVGLLLPAVFAIASSTQESPSTRASPGGLRMNFALLLLLLAFLAEGIGYIIPATFIVLFLSKSPPLHAYSNLAWLAVGAAAMPSVIAWNTFARHRSRFLIIALAMGLQAVGILAPVVVPNLTGVLLAAVSLGGTFVGITSLVIVTARELTPSASDGVIGLLTFVFAIGQIGGPLIVAQILGHGGTYATSLWISTVILIIGAAPLALYALHWRTLSTEQVT